MSESDASLDDFLAVCANERFATERDFYPTLGRVLRSLVSDETYGRTVQSALVRMSGKDRARGEYLILMLMASMKPGPRQLWATWQKSRGPVRYELSERTTFFHADARVAPEICLDEAASQFGLARGLNLAKFQQLLDSGTA